MTWKAFTIGRDAPIEWTATADRAEARLNGGTAAHVVLRRNPGMTNDAVVIRNLRYFGTPRNTGFILIVHPRQVGPDELEEIDSLCGQRIDAGAVAGGGERHAVRVTQRIVCATLSIARAGDSFGHLEKADSLREQSGPAIRS